MRTPLYHMLIIAMVGMLACTIEISAASAEDTAPGFAEYYQAGLDAFNRNDFQGAIDQWEKATRLNPSNKRVLDMLSAARARLPKPAPQKTTTVKPPSKPRPNPAQLQNDIRSLLERGDFKKTLEKCQELQAIQESGSNSYLAARLSRIVKVIPRECKTDRAGRLIRTSVLSFVSKKPDHRLCVNAVRYALQISPENPNLAGLVKFIESEFSSYAEREPISMEVSLIDQKLEQALKYIYDQKFNAAIQECNDVLALQDDNILALKRLGSAYYSLGQKTKALKAWKTAQSIVPEDPEINKILASIKNN
jgi:tetratricopeptide (TPR) repeat protein